MEEPYDVDADPPGPAGPAGPVDLSTYEGRLQLDEDNVQVGMTLAEFATKVRLRPVQPGDGRAECAICKDTLGPPAPPGHTPKQAATTRSCGHTFHKQCLWEWLSRKRTCPICRKDL